MKADIYLNEKYIGSTEKPKDFVKKIREERRKGKIPKELNISFDEELNEIHITTSSGRARRPLIVVENGVPKLTKEHTHMEISPITILGIITSLVPYSNFGQSSRLNRGSKTQKQALGLYSSNFLIRMDTDSNILHYPQVPIVKSFTHDVINYEKHPAGQNVVVALLSLSGYNMLDAIIINKGSVERGFGRSTYYRPYVASELKYQGGLMDEIKVPEKEIRGYRSEKDYRFLEDDGIAYPEANLNEGDVIIGKISPPRFLGDLEEFSIAANIKRESSVAVRQGEKGIVDFVVITENEEGNKQVEVRLRDQRIPELGDKFASRHGQKGVIGAIVPEADMPFTTSGIIPDLIFSPHSIPSRMTVNYLIEMIGGKVGALNGRYIEGTTFSAESEADLRKELLSLGFRENGTEKMYNGITGEEFKANIFIGNMYYMKLKHMVANKIHARASGRIQLLTRQPIEGRSKGGGLRLGEMEKDCFVAHGASLLLKERFDSDKTVVHVCENCGLLAVYNHYKNRAYCLKCGENAPVSPVEISYAFKLLLDELKALGIHPRLILKSKY